MGVRSNILEDRGNFRDGEVDLMTNIFSRDDYEIKRMSQEMVMSLCQKAVSISGCSGTSNSLSSLYLRLLHANL